MGGFSKTCSTQSASRGETVKSVDVYVKLPSGKTTTFILGPTDTIRTIKSRIAQDEDISLDLVIIKYTGKVLKDRDTLGYLGVCAETILKAEIITVKRYNIYVKHTSGKTTSIQVENISTISAIKDILQDIEDIPATKQIIKVSGVAVNDASLRLCDLYVSDEAILHLEEKIVAAKTKSKLRGKLGGRKGSVGSEASDTDDTEPSTSQAAEANLDENDKQAILNTFDAGNRNVEVVFSFDTTGSMYSCLQKVRDNLRDTIRRLLQHIPSIRIGIMAQGDYCDSITTYAVEYKDLTSDVDLLVDYVSSVSSTGGGDAPECYELILREAQKLDWSEDSAKALVVIGDDVPHCVSYTDQSINWHEELDLLKGMGVKVYGVRADHGSRATPFYQELADRTGGAYIEFKNFSIITDMFLAVCYREASEQQFDDFKDELLQQLDDEDKPEGATCKTGKEDLKNMLTQLDEQKNKKAADKSTRKICEPWWDPQLDLGSLQYRYKAGTDKWEKVTSHRSITTRHASLRATHTAPPKSEPSGIRRVFSLRGRSRAASGSTKGATKKKSCAIM